MLAGGRSFCGSAMYFLNYGVDLASGGFIGSTTSTELGSLFYFDWAPEQWDESLEHRTVRVVLPVPVASETVVPSDLTRVDFRTEPYVNEENATIDWFGTKGDDGRYYLTARFHQTDVGAEQTQRLHVLPEARCGADVRGRADRVHHRRFVRTRNDGHHGRHGRHRDDQRHHRYRGHRRNLRRLPGRRALPGSPIAAAALFAILVALIALLYWRKSAGFSKSVESVEKIKWAGDNWIPPKLVVGTYQVKGKIPKDLHPVEAALLLEMPLGRAVALMLEGLKRQNIIEVVEEDPLQIKILTAAKAEHEYEELFLQAFDTEGKVLSGLLSDFFEKVLAKLQEKVWDCDLEATKAYYRAKLEKKDETTEDRRRPELLVLVRMALRVLQPARVPAHAPALGVRLVLPAVHVVGLVLQGLFLAARRRRPAAWGPATPRATTRAIPPATTRATPRVIPRATPPATPRACRGGRIERRTAVTRTTVVWPSATSPGSTASSARCGATCSCEARTGS